MIFDVISADLEGAVLNGCPYEVSKDDGGYNKGDKDWFPVLSCHR